MPDGDDHKRSWRVTDEFQHRLGCGLVSAVVLPAWFAVIVLALGGEADFLAEVVALILFAVSLVVGVAAFRRLRRLPTEVSLDEEGWLRVTGRRIDLALPADAVVTVEIGAAVGLESVRLHTQQGRTVRLPGDLDDLDGFLSALRDANGALTLIDHRSAASGGEPQQ